MCDRNDPGKTNEELRLLYQFLTDAVRQAKNQIWSTLYYVTIIYGAIISFYDSLEFKKCEIFLIIVAGAACLGGIMLIAHYNGWMRDNRVIIRKDIIPRLSDITINVLENDKTKKRIEKGRWTWFDIIFLAGSIIIFLIGFTFVYWFLFSNKPI